MDMYVGGHIQGKRYGYGVCISLNGDKYMEGEWIDDNLQGVGMIGGRDGKVYMGDTRGGQREGVGRVEMGGKRYTGGFVQGHRGGVGRVEGKDGEERIGEWTLGNMHGYGEYTVPSRGYWYRGYFQGGMPAGRGEEGTRSSRYAGEFNGGNREGRGIAVLGGKGEEYIGYWKGGYRVVIGYEKKGGESYLGGWVGDRRDGIGVVDRGQQGKYTGEFNKGGMEGLGRLRGEDYLYIGGWRVNKRQGIGYEKRGDEIYFGHWMDGKKQGYGYLITPSREYKGEFMDDQMHGKGIMKIDYSENIVNFDHGREIPVTDMNIEKILAVFEKWDVEKFFKLSNEKLEIIEKELADMKFKIEDISSSVSIDFDQESTELHAKYQAVVAKLEKKEAELKKKRMQFLAECEAQKINLGIFKVLMDRIDSGKYSFSRKEIELYHEPSKPKLPADTTTHKPLFVGRLPVDPSPTQDAPERHISSKPINPRPTHKVHSPNASFGNDKDLDQDYSPDTNRQSSTVYPEGRSTKYAQDMDDHNPEGIVDSMYIRDIDGGMDTRRDPGWTVIKDGIIDIHRDNDDMQRFNKSIEESPAGKYLVSFRDYRENKDKGDYDGDRDGSGIKENNEEFSSHMDDFEDAPPDSEPDRIHFSANFNQESIPKPHKQSPPPGKLQTPERNFTKTKQSTYPPTLVSTEYQDDNFESNLGQAISAHKSPTYPSTPPPQDSTLPFTEILLAPEIIRGDGTVQDNGYGQMRVFNGRRDEIIINIGERMYSADGMKIIDEKIFNHGGYTKLIRQLSASYAVPSGDNLVVLDAKTNQLKVLDKDMRIIRTQNPVAGDHVFKAGPTAGHNADVRYKHSNGTNSLLWIKSYPSLDLISSQSLGTQHSYDNFFILRENVYMQPLTMVYNESEGLVCVFGKGSDGRCYLKWASGTEGVWVEEIEGADKEVWVDLCLLKRESVLAGYRRKGGETRGLLREKGNFHFLPGDKLSCIQSIDNTHCLVGGFEYTYLCSLQSPNVMRILRKTHHLPLRCSSSPTDFVSTSLGILCVFEKESRLFFTGYNSSTAPRHSESKSRIAEVLYSPQKGDYSPQSPAKQPIPKIQFDIKSEGVLSPLDFGQNVKGRELTAMAVRARGAELVVVGKAGVGTMRLDEKGSPAGGEMRWTDCQEHSSCSILEREVCICVNGNLVILENGKWRNVGQGELISSNSGVWVRRGGQLLNADDGMLKLVHNSMYGIDTPRNAKPLLLVHSPQMDRFCATSMLQNYVPTLVYANLNLNQRAEINFGHLFTHINSVELNMTHTVIFTAGANGNQAQLCAVKFDETLKPLASLTKSTEPFIKMRRIPNTETLIVVNKHSLFIFEFDSTLMSFQPVRELKLGIPNDIVDFAFSQDCLYLAAENSSRLYRAKFTSIPPDYNYRNAVDMENSRMFPQGKESERMPKITFEEPVKLQSPSRQDPRSLKVAAGKASMESLELIETKLGGAGGPSGSLLKAALADHSTTLYLLNSNLELLKTSFKQKLPGNNLRFELAVQEKVYDFFVSDEIYLLVLCIDRSKVIVLRQGIKVREMDNPSAVKPPTYLNGLTCADPHGGKEFVWFYNNEVCKFVDFTNVEHLSIGENIRMWDGFEDGRTIVGCVHRKSANRLIGLTTGLGGNKLRAVDLAGGRKQTVKAEGDYLCLNGFNGRSMILSADQKALLIAGSKSQGHMLALGLSRTLPPLVAELSLHGYHSLHQLIPSTQRDVYFVAADKDVIAFHFSIHGFNLLLVLENIANGIIRSLRFTPFEYKRPQVDYNDTIHGKLVVASDAGTVSIVQINFKPSNLMH
jgi:hypothetical protein